MPFFPIFFLEKANGYFSSPPLGMPVPSWIGWSQDSSIHFPVVLIWLPVPYSHWSAAGMRIARQTVIKSYLDYFMRPFTQLSGWSDTCAYYVFRQWISFWMILPAIVKVCYSLIKTKVFLVLIYYRQTSYWAFATVTYFVGLAPLSLCSKAGISLVLKLPRRPQVRISLLV